MTFSFPSIEAMQVYNVYLHVIQIVILFKVVYQPYKTFTIEQFVALSCKNIVERFNYFLFPYDVIIDSDEVDMQIYQTSNLFLIFSD